MKKYSAVNFTQISLWIAQQNLNDHFYDKLLKIKHTKLPHYFRQTLPLIK